MGAGKRKQAATVARIKQLDIDKELARETRVKKVNIKSRQAGYGTMVLTAAMLALTKS